jgi:hypothetical protein
VSDPQDPYAGQPYQPPPPYSDYPPYRSGPSGYPGSDPGYPGYPADDIGQRDAYYGYPPPPPGSYGYPYLPQNPRPAGSVVAAAVLSFVAAGLLVLAGVILFSSASFADGLSDAFGTQHDSLTTEIRADGFVNLVAAALLVPGGLLLLKGRVLGPTLIAVGSLVVVAAAVYWVARANQYGGTLFFAVLYAATVVTATALAFANSARAWLAAQTAAALQAKSPQQPQQSR